MHSWLGHKQMLRRYVVQSVEFVPQINKRSLKSRTFELDLKNRITIVGRERDNQTKKFYGIARAN